MQEIFTCNAEYFVEPTRTVAREKSLGSGRSLGSQARVTAIYDATGERSPCNDQVQSKSEKSGRLVSARAVHQSTITLRLKTSQKVRYTKQYL